MKKIILNNRIIAIALMTLFSIGNTQEIWANDKPTIPVTLTYVGKVSNQPAFLLQANGDDEHNDFKIVIFDEAGNQLYAETIKAAVFSKKFILNTEELGEGKLRFEITSRNSNQTINYEINRSSRVVEEMAIDLIK